MPDESPFSRNVKNKRISLGPSYLHELEVRRTMLRQEDRQRDFGWGGSWTKERFRDLNDEHPEALLVFETEIRLEKEGERHGRETFDRLMPSPYIEQVKRELPDSEEKDEYLRRLRNLE